MHGKAGKFTRQGRKSDSMKHGRKEGKIMTDREKAQDSPDHELTELFSDNEPDLFSVDLWELENSLNEIMGDPKTIADEINELLDNMENVDLWGNPESGMDDLWGDPESDLEELWGEDPGNSLEDLWKDLEEKSPRKLFSDVERILEDPESDLAKGSRKMPPVMGKLKIRKVSGPAAPGGSNEGPGRES